MSSLARTGLHRIRAHALTTAAGALLVAAAASDALRAVDGQPTLTGAAVRQLTSPTSPTRTVLGQLGR
jgi:hypothetical protein